MEIELSEKDFLEWCKNEGILFTDDIGEEQYEATREIDYVSIRSYENESHAYGIIGNLQKVTYWDSEPPLNEDQIKSLLEMPSATKKSS